MSIPSQNLKEGEDDEEDICAYYGCNDCSSSRYWKIKTKRSGDEK